MLLFVAERLWVVEMYYNVNSLPELLTYRL